MAKDKKENLKGLSKEELQKKIFDLEESKRSLRFKAQGAKPKNVKEYKNLKKTVAKVLTELNKK